MWVTFIPSPGHADDRSVADNISPQLSRPLEVATKGMELPQTSGHPMEMWI